MKVFLVVLLAVGFAQGNFLDDLKNSFQAIDTAVKQTNKDFVPFATDVGKNLLNEVKTDTMSMVSGTLANLLTDSISKLFHPHQKRNFLDDLKNSFQAIGSAVQQTNKDFVPFATDVGKNLLNEVKTDTMSMVSGTLANLLTDSISKLFTPHQKRNFLDDLKNSFQAIGSAVQQTNKDFVPFATDVGKNLLNEVKTDTMSMVSGTLANLLTDSISKLFTPHQKRNFLDDLKNSFQAIGSAVQQTNKDFVPFATDVGKNLLNEVKTDAMSMVSGTLANLLTDSISKLFTPHQKRNFLDDLKNSFQAIGSAVQQTNKDFVPFATDVGKNLLNEVKTDAMSMVSGTLANLLTDSISKLFTPHQKRNFLDDLKNSFHTIEGAIKQTGQDFKPYAKEVGKNLLNEVKNESTSMLGGVLSNILTDSITKLFHHTQKRNFLDDLKNSFHTIEGAIKQTGQDFKPYAKEVGKNLLNEVKNESTSMLGGVLSNLLTDSISHLFSHHKRDTAEVLEKGKQLVAEVTSLLDLGNSQYSQVIDEIFDEVEVISKKVKAMEMDPQEAIKMLDGLIAKHTSLSKEFLEALEREVNQVATKIFNQNKRDIVSSLGTTISTIYKPAMEGIEQLLKDMKLSILA